MFKRFLNKNFSVKFFIVKLILIIFFTVLSAPFIVLFGPFQNLKRTFVGAAMTTLNHKWLATTFLTSGEIDRILNSGEAFVNKSDIISERKKMVKIPAKTDNGIELCSFENAKYKGYYLIINDPKRVKVAYSDKLLKEGQTTSQMANSENAIAAINGGAFVDTSSNSTWSGNGGTPSGVIISDGKVIFKDSSMSSGAKSCVVGITNEGKLIVGEYSLDQLLSNNVRQAVSFYPVLVKEGQKVELSAKEREMGVASRSAIGQREDGAIIFLAIEGRTLKSPGASIEEMQQILIKYCKAVTALNLDGGRSTTLFFKGKVINKLSSNVGERYLPSAIVVK